MMLDYAKLLTSKIEEIPKPGWTAQSKMAPLVRQQSIIDVAVPPDARKAAVLFLLYPNHEQQLSFCLIQRPAYDGKHSSQISFPGGKHEEEDADLWATALRETEEEVGVKPSQIARLTDLSPTYIPPSNFWVNPFMGITHSKPIFSPDKDEVDHIIEVPLAALLDQSNLQTRKVTTSYMQQVEVPMFIFNSYEVWGATAMILSEAKELILSLPDFRIQ